MTLTNKTYEGTGRSVPTTPLRASPQEAGPSAEEQPGQHQAVQSEGINYFGDLTSHHTTYLHALLYHIHFIRKTVHHEDSLSHNRNKMKFDIRLLSVGFVCVF